MVVGRVVIVAVDVFKIIMKTRMSAAVAETGDVCPGVSA